MCPAAELAAPRPRRRLWVAGILATTIALGLLSRRYPLPGILAEYTGDALYCSAAFGGLALVFVSARTRVLAAAAFGFSAAVEFSQLLSWQWLADLRPTLFGRLVLGSGFQWPDLVAYLVGAMAASAVDATIQRRRVCTA